MSSGLDDIVSDVILSEITSIHGADNVLVQYVDQISLYFTDLCDTHYITCIYVSTQNGYIYVSV